VPLQEQTASLSGARGDNGHDSRPTSSAATSASTAPQSKMQRVVASLSEFLSTHCSMYTQCLSTPVLRSDMHQTKLPQMCKLQVHTGACLLTVTALARCSALTLNSKTTCVKQTLTGWMLTSVGTFGPAWTTIID
jgi:hypothetical protein